MHWSIDVNTLFVLAGVSGAALFAFLVPSLVHTLRLPSRSTAQHAPRYLNLSGAHATPNIRRTPHSSDHHEPSHTLPSL